VLTERMLELDLLLDSVLDLEWRLVLLALTPRLDCDKLGGLKQFRLAILLPVPVEDWVLGSDASRCLYFVLVRNFLS
jgi:hypothetical protein